MAIATDLAVGTILLTADLHGSADGYAPELTPTGVAPGTYLMPDLVVDIKGRILYASSISEVDLNCATTVACGVVIVGDNIDVTAGEISIPLATIGAKGVVKVGSGFQMDGDLLSVDYDLATPTTIGLVIVPTAGYIDVDGSGNISVPQCSESVFGVMKAGTGLDVTAGVVSVDETELAVATATTVGVASVGSNIDVSVGEISIPQTSTSEFGVCKGDEVGIEVVGGIISAVGGSPAPTDDATTTSKGVMQIGDHLNDTGGAGIVGVDKASGATTYGVVRSADTNNLTITTGQIDVGTNIPKKDAANSYTKAQVDSMDTLTFSASITPDFSLGTVFELTLTGNTTINAPTNGSNGGAYVFIIKQDGSGGHAVTFNSAYKFMSAPTITTNANAVDTIGCVRLSSTKYISQHVADYK